MTVNIFDMTDSWNNPAVDFTSIRMNVTFGNGSANSKLIDLLLAGASRFYVDTSGTFLRNQAVIGNPGGDLLSLQGGAQGSAGVIIGVSASSIDPNVNIHIVPKNAAGVNLYSNNSLQLSVAGPAGTTHYIQTVGSISGNPTIVAGGGGRVEINDIYLTGTPEAPTPQPFSDGNFIATTHWVKQFKYVQTAPPTTFNQLAGYADPPDGTLLQGIDLPPFGLKKVGPVLQLSDDLGALEALTGTNSIYYRSGTSTWTEVTIGPALVFAGGVLDVSPGGSVAPSGAEYITASTNPTLTAERVLTDSATITWDFTTPGQVKATSLAGGGNVSSVPTPTSGQYAKWTGATTIQGVAVGTVLTDIGAQPLDSDLTALAAASLVNTIYYRSGVGAWSGVTIGPNMTFTGGVLDSTASGFPEAPNDGALYGRQSLAWAKGVKLAGDTMTGDLKITKSTPVMSFDTSNTGQNRGLIGLTLGSPRWRVYLGNSSPESGSNLGSDFVVQRYADAGTVIDSPITIARNTGAVDFSANPTLVGVPLATQAFVTSTYAPLANPTFTGDPKAPTPATADNDTSIATTAFVKAQGYGTGNVSVSGTPGANDVGIWVTSSTIKGTPLVTHRTNAKFAGTLEVSPTGNIAAEIGWRLQGAASGGANALMSVQGADADIGFLMSSKGNGSIFFYNGNFGRVAMGLSSEPGANTFITMIGRAGRGSLGVNPAQSRVDVESDDFHVLLTGALDALRARPAASGGTQVLGTTAADSAPAGFVGEVVTASWLNTSISASTTTNPGFVALTAGDWDVVAHVTGIGSGSGPINFVIGISATPGGPPAYPNASGAQAPTSSPAAVTLTQRFNLSATQQINCNVQNNSGTLALNCHGIIIARRRR